MPTLDQKWLLVFDNVEHWGLISNYWPKTAREHSAIIVTSQNQEFRPQTTFECLLPDLSVDEGSELLMSYAYNHLDRPDDQGASEAASRKIAEMFGGLPLAIAHIGGYVGDAHCTPVQFIEILEQRYRSLWECDLTVSNPSVAKLKLIADVALQELPAEAKTLLYAMAFLNTDTIHAAMFTGSVTDVAARVSGANPPYACSQGE